MTPELLEWMQKNVKPAQSVLEAGAYNVNGTARSVIIHDTWFGTDMRAGPDVDWVCPAENLQHHFGPIFDLVVCCEMLEHAENWRAALVSMWNCVRKSSGCMVLSTPGHNFPQHDYPSDYQRFSIPFWLNMFYDQHILARATIRYPHEGDIIYVRKLENSLDFARAGEPLPVPPGPT